MIEVHEVGEVERAITAAAVLRREVRDGENSNPVLPQDVGAAAQPHPAAIARTTIENGAFHAGAIEGDVVRHGEFDRIAQVIRARAHVHDAARIRVCDRRGQLKLIAHAVGHEVRVRAGAPPRPVGNTAVRDPHIVEGSDLGAHGSSPGRGGQQQQAQGNSGGSAHALTVPAARRFAYPRAATLPP